MADIQELIIRGRIAFSGAPKRLEVFILINSKKSTKDIARKSGRGLSSVLKDAAMLRDMELIREKRDPKGNTVKRDNATVFEKTPLARHIPPSYFRDVSDTAKLVKKVPAQRTRAPQSKTIHIPSDNEILDICRNNEDQLYEFKSPGTDSPKITKEIAAFLHTKAGGILFYGIDDDGSIIGSDIRRQEFDQKIHNSIRNTITPQPGVTIKEKNVLGSKIILVAIPPWDRKTFYQYTKDKRYYIRRGTNIFALTPDELKKMSKGEHIT